MTRFPLLQKILALSLVALLLSLVLARISFLVDERQARQQEAVRSVQQAHAGAQTLLGPLLQRHCVESWTERQGEGKDRRDSPQRREFTLSASPDSLQVSTQVNPQSRYRGLFKVNSYTAKLLLRAQWSDPQALHASTSRPGAQLHCQPLRLLLAVDDVRGVQQASVRINDSLTLPVLPGTGHALHTHGLHADVPAPVWPPVGATGPATLHAQLELVLNGTAQLALVPVATATEWQLQSDWPHPSFGGRFLPAEREVGPQGFSARWQVSALASTAPREVHQQQVVCRLTPGSGWADVGYDSPDGGASASNCLDTMVVSFIDPINPYVLADRATKYGLLFIALTFVAVAVVEVLASGRGLRVHPIQYGLVGLALCLFFLLLLSVSEHLGFALAYGLASSACVALLGFYAVPMLGRRRDAGLFAVGLSLLYGLVYLLLLQEQTALVIGSLGLFMAVAVVMVLTRRVNWYALTGQREAD